ncbi:hypothetical protein ACFL49_03485 [Candidatus Omnitrophota bacterium]
MIYLLMNALQQKPKAVGLISGGLDSTLAAKLVKDCGVDVMGVYFAMPWGCGSASSATRMMKAIDVPLKIMQLDEDYLDIVRKPNHGYGSALNPCVDCKIYMIKKAREYMDSLGADFLFTGEVLGQRPMSQLKHSLQCIEKQAQLKRKLLRPLCAQLLPPTEVEENGLIDRNKLLGLNGRGRKPQIQMAKDYGILDFVQPAGGCLLTDKNFSNRMIDAFTYGFRNFEETIALQWGRHFRINDEFKAIIGRDEKENDSLMEYAHADDHIIQPKDTFGPTCILKGYNPSKEMFNLCGGLIQHFSKNRGKEPVEMLVWPAKDPKQTTTITAVILDEAKIDEIKI